MYNEEIKQQFIKFINDKSKSRYVFLFDTLEPLEKTHGMDLYDMPYEQAITYLLQNITYSQYKSIYDRFTQIKQYKRWALNFGYVHEDARALIDEKCNVKALYLKYCQVVIYKTPDEFAEMLNRNMYGYVDLGEYRGVDGIVTVDDITKAYLMLVYQGFTQDEALQLKMSNIRETNHGLAIVTDNKVCTVYPAFLDAIDKLYHNRNYYRVYGRVADILELGDRFIDNGLGNDDTALAHSFASIYVSRDLRVKLSDIYCFGKLYDFFANHDSEKRYKKSEILSYCFAGEKITRSRRDQFYRWLELWNR